MFDASHDQAVSHSAKCGDLVYEALVLPASAPAWAHGLVAGLSIAKGSEALWNAVTAFEKRADATFSRELEMALARELDRAEWVALVQDFVASEITPKGFVADWVIHNPHKAADPDAPDQAVYDNPHVHLMHTLRPLHADGFGPKVVRVQDAGGAPIVIDGKYRYVPFVGGPKELLALRLAWGEVVNRHLKMAGHDIRIDMRSYADQGVKITPMTHIGPEPGAMADRLAHTMRSHSVADHAVSRARAAADIIDNPGALLVKISRERSTFSDRDIARELYRYVDDATLFGDLLAQIKALPELLVVRVDG